jgi:hypothetical protein
MLAWFAAGHAGDANELSARSKSMLKISDYLRHAEECEALAKTARTPEEAESLRQMAAPWRKLAETGDREIRCLERVKELEPKDRLLANG